MARRKKNIPKGAVFSGLVLLSLLFLILPQKYTNKLNFIYSRTFSSILSFGRTDTFDFFRPASSSDDYVSRAEYNRLLAAYDNLHADLIALNEDYEKLARIKSELPKPGPVTRLAYIRNVSISGLAHELLINKGSKQGIKKGQYVLGENCVIGTISEVSDLTSSVKLVTDSTHKMEVRLYRPGRKGYIPAHMVGNGTDGMKLPLISRDYDIKEGDTVYAAARPGYLETSVVVGKVAEVSPDESNPLLLDVLIKPIYNVEDLAEASVAVILMEE